MDATERAVERLAAVLAYDARLGPTIPVARAVEEGAHLLANGDPTQRAGYLDRARTLLRELGLVAVPRELVEAVERAEAEYDASGGRSPDAREMHTRAARLALADAFLAALRGTQ